MKHHCRRGFTLTELLAVIAAMVLVAAVVWPLCARARQRARLSSCASNFLQYSRAFRMYAEEYDETLPLWSVAVAYRPGELDVTTWDLLLLPYLKSMDAGRCPSDPAPAVYAFIDGRTLWRSYAVPRNLIWNPGETANPRDSEYPMKLAGIREPQRTLLFTEKTQGNEVNGAPYPATLRPATSWTRAAALENFQQVAWERHGERVNALFADGHVRALRGRRQGGYRTPPEPQDARFTWPILPGYINRRGAGSPLARNANGAQFWEDCPIPGESPTRACR